MKARLTPNRLHEGANVGTSARIVLRFFFDAGAAKVTPPPAKAVLANGFESFIDEYTSTKTTFGRDVRQPILHTIFIEPWEPLPVPTTASPS